MPTMQEEMKVALDLHADLTKRIVEIHRVQFGLVSLLRARSKDLAELEQDLADLDAEAAWGEF